MDLAKAIHDAEMANPDLQVKNLFKGDCRGCGQCCSRFLPMSSFDIKRIHDHVTEHGIEQRPEASEADLMCPYLDIESKECRIYSARPDVCRGYRCDLHAMGDMDAISAFMLHGPYIEMDLRELDLPGKEGDE